MDEEVWPYQKYDDGWGRDIATLPPGLQSLRASMFFNKCMDAVTLPSGLLYLTFWRALQPKPQRHDSTIWLAKPYFWPRRRFDQNGPACLSGLSRVTSAMSWARPPLKQFHLLAYLTSVSWTTSSPWVFQMLSV